LIGHVSRLVGWTRIGRPDYSPQGHKENQMEELLPAIPLRCDNWMGLYFVPTPQDSFHLCVLCAFVVNDSG
jgi:hypothetical protein